MDLAEEVYKIAVDFPKEERFGLTAQIKRCAVSIPSNISEGAGRATNKQFKQFLQIFMGSCNELQTQLELAKRFGYISEEVNNKINNEVLQVFKMTLAFYNSLPDSQ